MLLADKQVYAGTCLFPETTWFSKNLAHAQLVQIDPIVTEFFKNDGNFTVDSKDEYPQFFNYENGKFIEVEAIDAGDDNSSSGSPVWANNPFLVFIRFFTALFEFITARLKK